MRAYLDDIFNNFRKDPRVIEQRQLAKARKWRFASRRKMEREPEALQQMNLFKGRRSKRLSAIIRISSPRLIGDFRIYDYVYFADFGKRTTTVLEFHCPKFNLSPFSIQPKKGFRSMREMRAAPDYLFATTPEFNKRYRISAHDLDEIKIDLNEHFLDYVGDEAGWTYEGRKDFLIGYQQSTSIPTEDIVAELKRFGKICEQLV